MGPAPDKSDLRRRALVARAAGGDAEALTRNLAAALGPWAGEAVAGYWPIRGEADPRPALAHHAGPLCLPVILGPARPLIFRGWDGGEDDLETGPFNTRQPGPNQAPIRPRVVIVPMAGFDRAGHRLGYGGGYYDRTLASLRASGPVLALGCAYACQELPVIPAEPTDERLDLIVTDREIIAVLDPP